MREVFDFVKPFAIGPKESVSTERGWGAGQGAGAARRGAGGRLVSVRTADRSRLPLPGVREKTGDLTGALAR